jgi:hypothetical protein
MQCLEVSCAVRPLGDKGLSKLSYDYQDFFLVGRDALQFFR